MCFVGRFSQPHTGIMGLLVLYRADYGFGTSINTWTSCKKQTKGLEPTFVTVIVYGCEVAAFQSSSKKRSTLPWAVASSRVRPRK